MSGLAFGDQFTYLTRVIAREEGLLEVLGAIIGLGTATLRVYVARNIIVIYDHLAELGSALTHVLALLEVFKQL